MKLNYILIFIFAFGFLQAQDKLIFKDGRKKYCSISSINDASVSYRDSSNAATLITVSKQELIMAEYKNGAIYIFGSNPGNFNTYTIPKNDGKSSGSKLEDKIKAKREREKTFSNNIIGFQVPDLFFGRLTLTYERLFNEKQMGIVIPATMSFDPRAIFSRLDTNPAPHNQIRRGVGFISGLDLNYYIPTRGYSKFFVGPRFRYGTDMYMLGLTGYSFQLQNGFLLCSASGKLASTFAIGFGYVRILSLNGINPKQSFPWGSFTIRIGFRR